MGTPLRELSILTYHNNLFEKKAKINQKEKKPADAGLRLDTAYSLSTPE
jgi:hypothetical protein